MHVAVEEERPWYLPFNSYFKNITFIAIMLKRKNVGQRKRSKGCEKTPLPVAAAEMNLF